MVIAYYWEHTYQVLRIEVDSRTTLIKDDCLWGIAKNMKVL